MTGREPLGVRLGRVLVLLTATALSVGTVGAAAVAVWRAARGG